MEMNGALTTAQTPPEANNDGFNERAASLLSGAVGEALSPFRYRSALLEQMGSWRFI